MGNNLFIYHTVCCVMDLIKMYLIIHYIIGFQKQENIFKIIVSLISLPFIMLLLTEMVPEKYLSLFYLPIILFILFFVSGIWHLKSFLLSIISYVTICEVDLFNASMFQLVPMKIELLYRRDNMSPSVLTLISIVILSSICKKMNISFFKKSFGTNKIFVLIEVGVLFFNIGMIGIFFGVLSENEAGGYSTLLLIGVVIVLMMLSVITLIFYSLSMNVKEYQMVNRLNEKQILLQKKHYERLKEIHIETRKFQHDTKNHFYMIHNFMQEQKYMRAEEYLREYEDKFTKLIETAQCGNYIADAILNEANRRCKESNITLEVAGVIHAKVQLSNTDMVTILGNAIDNAVEACEKIIDGAKSIKVSFGLYQEYLHIVISNTTNGKVSRITEKKDKFKHGFGLNNIKECVKRNSGTTKIKIDQNVFEMDILVKAFDEVI